MIAGGSTILSQPPKEGAMYGIFKESMNILVSTKPPASCTTEFIKQ